jgi:hypothetical protein
MQCYRLIYGVAALCSSVIKALLILSHAMEYNKSASSVFIPACGRQARANKKIPLMRD